MSGSRGRRLDAIESKVQRRRGEQRPRPEDTDRLEGDLRAFVPAAWPVLEPARSFVANWHHDLLAEYLTAVFQGQVKRLLVNIPPRHTKSRFATVLWPCWCWAQRPEAAWIFGSYAAGLSVRHSLDRRAVLSSDWYQARWGDRARFADDQNLKAEFENTARGTMVATSVGGSAMGLGADVIVVDDPHNPEQALSEAERETALRWFDQTLTTRLNDPATGAIVVIMQRLHQQDLSGHLLEQGDWVHVALPAEAEDRERVVFPVSGVAHEREPGELLWPERFTQDVLAKQKRRLGAWAYAGQFQQRPTPLGGGIFKRDWWRFYDELPPTFESLVASWDCAFKDTKGSDYVVGQVWGKRGADCYLLDQVRGRWSFPGTVQAIRSLAGKWPQATAKLVEDKANGPAVIDTLKHEIPGLIAINPEGGKVVRAQAVSPLIESGNVYLPNPAHHPWVEDFLEECGAFPNGAHDDQVDAMTQALRRLGAGNSGDIWITLVKEWVLGDAAGASNIARGTVRTRL
jgi:predicted phage terminase large subunit-like protein